MRRVKGWMAAVCLAAVCLAAGGCAAVPAAQSAPARYRTTFLGAMDTVVNLTAYCRTSAQFDAAAAAARQELERLDAVFDRYSEESDLSRVNAGAGGAGVAAAPELIALIERCRALQSAVPGVNIAMGSVLELWHTARQTGVPPAAGELEAAARHCRMADVVIEGGTVRLADPAMSLDMGAVAKGAIADAVAALLKGMGVDTFLLDCGTSTIVCAGSPPDKSGWTVALRNPDAVLNLSGASSPPELIGTAALADRCLSVSGDYQKYFVHEGTYYPHIIDEATLRPAAHFRAVAVLAGDAAAADYYSTALFTRSYEEGRQAAQAAGIEAVWIFPDGSRRATDGFLLTE